ncbi:MAG: metallophosphoesterase family protein [Mycoplasmoidaceae bacterium]
MDKILIFSDSHSDNEIMKKVINFEEPNLILHAGDYCCDHKIMEEFIDYFCSGNNDDCNKNENENGARIVRFEFRGVKIILTHSDFFTMNYYDIEQTKMNMVNYFKLQHPDVIIYGHTHKEDVQLIDNILFINPGSISLPRNEYKNKTYAILYIENNMIVNKEYKDIIKIWL